MFRFIRNVHLALGVAFFFVALLFALSSIVLIYQPRFPSGPVRTQTAIRLQPGLEARAAAIELMRSTKARGDLRDIQQEGGNLKFVVWRPGTQVDVTYTPQTGEAKLDARRFNFFETLAQLHVNHGFWHDFLPANLWALLSLGVSVGLLLLGASGIYLWYKHPRERFVGNFLLLIGFAVPVVTLLITRLQGG